MLQEGLRMFNNKAFSPKTKSRSGGIFQVFWMGSWCWCRLLLLSLFLLSLVVLVVCGCLPFGCWMVCCGCVSSGCE